MFDWKTLWCFYNSSAFTIITTLVLLGAISVVIPALINLPAKRSLPNSDLNTPTIKFNKCRIWTRRSGWFTIVLSLGPTLVYLYLLDKMDGETCDVQVPIQESEVYPFLLLLYLLSALVLFSFGFFYLKWQETLRRDDNLGDRTSQ